MRALFLILRFPPSSLRRSIVQDTGLYLVIERRVGFPGFMRAFTHGERGREREMHTDVRVVRKPPKWPRQWHGGILVAQDIRSGSFYGAPLFFPSPFSPSFGIKSADSTLRNAENTKLAHRKRGGYASRLRDLLIVRRVHPSLSPLHFLSFALCLSLYISAVCRHMRVADTCCVCLP